MNRSLLPGSTFSVLLAIERGLDRKHAEEVVDWFERFPGPINVKFASKPVELPLNEDGKIQWGVAFNKLKALRLEQAVGAETFLGLLTKSPNEENWYAVQDPTDMRNGFAHVGDFSWVTSAPSSVISVHYVLWFVFSALIQERIPGTTMWHQPPQGCFFDFCENKSELNLKLRTADICGECMEILHAIGIPDTLIQQTVNLMESGRPFALNTSQYRPPEREFDRWPFPVAVTRHKVVQAVNPTLKLLLLLAHFDSLIRYFFLAREILANKSPMIEDNPSLGWWVDRLAHSLKGEKQYREVVSIAQQQGVVALRNDYMHGYAPPDTAGYEEDAARLEKILSDIEEEMGTFLKSHQLLIADSVEPREDGYLLCGLSLRGSHLLHPPIRLNLASEPRAIGLTRVKRVYIADGRFATFHCMSPYIRSATCPTCHHSRVMITDGSRRYIDIFMGHRVTLQSEAD